MNYLERPQNGLYLGNQYMENAFLIVPKSLYPKRQNIPFKVFFFYLTFQIKLFLLSLKTGSHDSYQASLNERKSFQKQAISFLLFDNCQQYLSLFFNIVEDFAADNSYLPFNIVEDFTFLGSFWARKASLEKHLILI